MYEIYEKNLKQDASNKRTENKMVYFYWDYPKCLFKKNRDKLV